jgi:hypothetical protein
MLRLFTKSSKAGLTKVANAIGCMLNRCAFDIHKDRIPFELAGLTGAKA